MHSLGTDKIHHAFFVPPQKVPYPSGFLPYRLCYRALDPDVSSCKVTPMGRAILRLGGQPLKAPTGDHAVVEQALDQVS